MQGSIRKLALAVGLSLALNGLSPAPLRAQPQRPGDDSDDPRFVQVSPAGGTVIAATDVTITGRVEDSSPVEVFTGDIRTKADGEGRFTLKGVPIKQGKNTITLKASDTAGHEGEFELELIGKDLVPPAAPVVFAVKHTTRLSYQIVEGRSEPESRVVITGGARPALADAAYGTGLFTAFVRLREGRNDLTVVALDDAGASPPVSVSVERAGAGGPPPPDGEAAQINISSGATQRALPGSEFPRPLVARVTDARGLPVEGVRVEFTVRHGGARFAGGRERDTALTDEDGRAGVRLRAGGDTGINMVRADFDGNTSSPAAFDVETIEPRGDKETSVSGLLLSVFSQPLEGVSVRLGKATARTGHDGRFTMQKVEPGLDQRLEVSGQDVSAHGYKWTDASYPIDVLPGADNSLGRPLFVSPLNEGVPLGAGPPLALDREGRVTSKGAVLAWQDDYYGPDAAPEVTVLRGVRVTAAPPATLDGREFSATRVLGSRVPVTLDDGLTTGLYFFVGPRAVAFDPPLPFKFHNSDKLAPRSHVLIMHYDEGAGAWRKEGTAHVTDDGKAVVNDAGGGIRGGGWYAFPWEKTQPEYTNVDFIQVAGTAYEGLAFVYLEAYSEGKTAVLAAGWGEGEFKRLHFRVTLPALNGEPVFGNKGMEPGDLSRDVEVTVTPSEHAMEPGDKVLLYAVGRPHPGGYYVWTSSDPSVASVEPLLNDGGAQHPNRANVVAHRPGTAKISATYITTSGATSVGSSEVICRRPR